LTQHSQELFKYEGISPAVEMLLEGRLEVDATPDLDSGSCTLLKHLGNGKQLPRINSLIDFDMFARAVKKWPEKTSTSPSSRHLGHCKCLVVVDGHSKDYNETNPDPSKSILSIYHRIATIALSNGISLERGQNSTTSMIEKTPGNSKINKL
jgi:hypothetical protein